jgi:hypothetical protein
VSDDALVIAAHPDDAGPHRLEAEDQCYGRIVGVRFAQIFRTAAPLLVSDSTMFDPVPQG